MFGNDVGSYKCQCSRMPAARVDITKHNVKSEEVSSTYDCDKMHKLHVPLNQFNQVKEIDLQYSLDVGVLDCLCQSINSCPSPD